MTWTTKLPTKPGWYYRRVTNPGVDEMDIVSIYESQWSHEPIPLLLVERFGEDGAMPVSGYVTGFQGDVFQYEFQPVKPPD